MAQGSVNEVRRRGIVRSRKIKERLFAKPLCCGFVHRQD
jgi:hypothetical protein